MTSADFCRERGWKVGDIIRCEYASGRYRILRITAIGEKLVLGCTYIKRWGWTTERIRRIEDTANEQWEEGDWLIGETTGKGE